MKITQHLAKAITWRILATGTTIFTAYLVTGEVSLSLSIGVIEASAKIILYIVHDYMWEQLPHLE